MGAGMTMTYLTTSTMMTMVCVLTMIVSTDIVWATSHNTYPEEGSLLLQPNPLVGALWFALLYYGCYRRWMRTHVAVVAHTPVASIHQRAQSAVVIAKAYDKTRWFVYVKVLATLAVCQS